MPNSPRSITAPHGRPVSELPDPDLLAFAASVLGEVEVVGDLSWDHGESGVWAVRGSGRGEARRERHGGARNEAGGESGESIEAGGESSGAGPRSGGRDGREGRHVWAGLAVLKAHRQARKFRQELTANREWLPRLRTEAASVTASVAASEATPDSVPAATPAAGCRRGGAEGARQRPAGEARGRPGEAAAMDVPGSLAAQAGTPSRVGPPPLWAGPPELGVRTPSLLGWREAEPRALLFSWEAGALLQDLELPVDRERELHGRAGAFLRALHELPIVDRDPLPLAGAFTQRLDAWSERAAGIVPGPVVERVRGFALEAVPALRRIARVPCHRDYTPRNWLLAEDGALVIIDFEHSRPDLYLNDFERLWTGLWRQRADLRDAFLAGYGRELASDEEETLRRAAALGALSTVVWAREHADARFEEHGWETLRWLGLAGG